MAKKPHLKLHNDGSMSYRVDAWSNPISGQGIPGIDKSLGQVLSPAFSHLMHNNQQVLTNIYLSDWLARKICDLPAEDATRKFIEITGLDGEDKKRVESMLDDMGLRASVRKGISWSRLFGGAGVLKVYDDSRPPESPPSETAAIIDLVPLDRWSLSVDEIDLDPESPHYGRALNYVARNGVTYHRDRIAPFYGCPVPYDTQIELQGWGGSYVAMAWSAIAAYNETLQDASFLLKESGIGILSVPNLTAAQSMGMTASQAVMNRANAFNQGKSIYRAAVVDKEENFGFVNRSLQGIPDFVDRFATAVAGATGLSEMMLFGKSPAGLNASQEEILSVYYDKIAAIQEGDPAALVQSCIDNVKMQTGLDFDWKWAELSAMSPDKKATSMASVATAIATLEQSAALTPNEVRNLANDSGLFSLEELPEDDDNSNDDPLGLNSLGGGNGTNGISETTGSAEAGQAEA